MSKFKRPMCRVTLAVILLFSLSISTIYAHQKQLSNRRTWYFGVMGGVGSTTWRGLVPRIQNQNAALLISTPIEAKEGGGVYGIFADYEFSPFFAVEVNYVHFPDAIIIFDEFSLFSFNNQGQTRLKTKTDTTSLLAKVLMDIPSSPLRLYSGAGITSLHRHDMVVNQSRLTPIFVVGINSSIHQHLLAEISGQYTTGYGESNLNPTNIYMPFLYAIVFKLAYVV